MIPGDDAMVPEEISVTGSDPSPTETASDPGLPDTLRNPEAVPKKPRGFAAMDPEHRRAISRKGGKAAHEKGTAHKFTSEEATTAGRKGGLAPHVKRGPKPRLQHA